MAQIAVAVLLQLAAACSASSVPAERIVATAKVESAFEANALGDNTTHRSYAPATAAEAATTARALLAQGHSIDAGVMQVNSGNWGRLGLTAETAFDPARNVCAGVQVLAEAYDAERRVSCRYNTGRPDCTNGYPEKIARAMGAPAELPPPLPPVVSSVVPVTSAPLPARPPYWDVYAIARAAKPLRAQPAQSAPVQLTQR